MRQRFAWGVGLVVLGTLLLLRELGAVPDVSLFSIIVLAVGLWLFVGAVTGRHHGWIWTLGVVAAGVLLVLRDLEVLPEDFSVWPVAIIVIGMGVLADAFSHRRRPAARSDRADWGGSSR